MDSFLHFVNPSPIYHGTDFWMLNDTLDEDEIACQLSEMKKQGVTSFIARTYIGLKSDYPGKDFRQKLAKIIETAKALDMKLFLQAGYMPEHIPNLSEEDALRGIHIYPKGSPIPNEEELIHTHNGFSYTIFNSKTYLDMFGKDSVAHYLKRCYEDMWEEFSNEYGKTIISIWVDEPSYSDRFLPYPKNLENAFYNSWGYHLKDKLHLLFIDEEGYQTTRFHYRKTLQELLENHYFKQLKAWCNKNNLLASGHLMNEDSMAQTIARSCSTMPFYKYFDIPGIDLLCGQMNWRKDAIIPPEENFSYRNCITNTPIQCASAARQAGCEHILCEMYGVTSQNMTFKNQKHHFDYLIAHGVNHRCVHGIFYSLHGRAKRTYPPHINYYQPYWNDLHLLYDYVASTSQFASLGKPVSECLVLYPIDSAYCEYTNKAYDSIVGKQKSTNALALRDKEYHDLLVSLSLSNCIFDLGDEKTISDWGQIQNNHLIVGKASYKTIVLPNLLMIGSKTIELIEKFQKNGGRVVILRNAPKFIDGYPIKEKLLSNAEIAQSNSELAQILAQDDYLFDSPFDNRNIYIRKRVDGVHSYYFLFNADCSTEKEGTLTIKGTVKAELWDGFTRERTKLSCFCCEGKTTINLTIPEGGSLMLHTETTEVETKDKDEYLPTQTLALGEAWEIEPQNPNVLLLEFCSFKRSNGHYSDSYPVLAIQHILLDENYKGRITQKYIFKSEEVLAGLKIALEDASKHKVFFNGKQIDNRSDGYYFSRSFQTIPLPICVKGENIIELEREFQPPSKKTGGVASLYESQNGVELESAYLIGDFDVITHQEPERNGNIRFSRNMSLKKRGGFVKGELTKAGYPFYSGTVRLSKSFKLKSASKVFLQLEEMNGCLCRVYINHKEAGVLHCPPYKIDISNLVTSGENTLTLELTNTLRNLLGPYHRPFGEWGQVWGGSYNNPDIGWMGVNTTDAPWYIDRTTDTPYWTDSYLLTSFGVKGAKLVLTFDRITL